VQGFESSQFVAPPGTHAPSPQVSPVVQALPSEHGTVLFVCPQPVVGLQESSVQGFESSQLVGPPGTQAPPPHVSPVVQAFPSEQGAVLFVWTQPVPESHVSSVHGFESSQFVAPPGAQAPPPQVSPVVQESPSEQGAVLFV